MNRQLLSVLGMNPDYLERVLARMKKRAAKKRARLVARREKRDGDEAVALRDVLALQADGPIADQAQARLKELGR